MMIIATRLHYTYDICCLLSVFYFLLKNPVLQKCILGFCEGCMSLQQHINAAFSFAKLISKGL
jgi:hypothetical protein